MVDIASCSHGATIGLVYDLHHIARSVLHQIREEHRIAGYDQEASTSHKPFIRPPVSSTPVCMHPIRGRGRERVDRRGCGRGHCRDSEGGRGTPESTLLTSIPPPPPPIIAYHSRFLYPHRLIHHLPYPRHLHIFTISGVAKASLHNSRYHLIIPPFITPYITSHW